MPLATVLALDQSSFYAVLARSGYLSLADEVCLNLHLFGPLPGVIVSALKLHLHHTHQFISFCLQKRQHFISLEQVIMHDLVSCGLKHVKLEKFGRLSHLENINIKELAWKITSSHYVTFICKLFRPGEYRLFLHYSLAIK